MLGAETDEDAATDMMDGQDGNGGAPRGMGIHKLQLSYAEVGSGADKKGNQKEYPSKE